MLKKTLVVRNTIANIQYQGTPATWREVRNYDQFYFHCGSTAAKEEEGFLDKSLDYEFYKSGVRASMYSLHISYKERSTIENRIKLGAIR